MCITWKITRGIICLLSVLVPGSARFIWSRLCRYLLYRGYSGAYLVNFFTDRRGDIAAIANNDYFVFLRNEITQQILAEIEGRYNPHVLPSGYSRQMKSGITPAKKKTD